MKKMYNIYALKIKFLTNNKMKNLLPYIFILKPNSICNELYFMMGDHLINLKQFFLKFKILNYSSLVNQITSN